MRPVVSVAYPFAPVGPDAVGGAEQVLSAIDRAIVARGGRSIVLACPGSRCAGELVEIPDVSRRVDDDARARMYPAVRRILNDIVRETRACLVHMHGVDFYACLPEGDVPVLATLHLPLSFYPSDALRPTRPFTWLHGVSASQMQRDRSLDRTLAPIPNGVSLTRFTPEPDKKRRYVLALGRICPEKAFHLALDAAREARLPLLLAGQVFPYASHERYYDDVLTPRMGGAWRYLGPVGGSRKRRLLARARALVVASQVAETSSLVAMEALASGTPVVAFPAGALADIVEHGSTGFLVDDVPSMARAMRAAAALSPRDCRASAEQRFGEDAMVRGYFEAYRALARAPAKDVPWLS